MTEQPDTKPTIRQRALSIGISPERLDEHVAEKRLRVDGELVTDLDAPTEPVSRIVAWPTAEG